MINDVKSMTDLQILHTTHDDSYLLLQWFSWLHTSNRAVERLNLDIYVEVTSHQEELDAGQGIGMPSDAAAAATW